MEVCCVSNSTMEVYDAVLTDLTWNWMYGRSGVLWYYCNIGPFLMHSSDKVCSILTQVKVLSMVFSMEYVVYLHCTTIDLVKKSVVMAQKTLDSVASSFTVFFLTYF